MDTRIPLAVRAPDIVGAIGKGIQLKGLQTQQSMQDMQLRQAEDEAQAQRTLADLYRGNVGADGQVNRAGVLQGAADRGLGARIPGLQKQFAEADKLGAEVKNTNSQIDERQFGVAKKKLEATGAGLQSLLANPNATPDDALNMLQGLVNAGIMTPEEGAKAWREVPTGSPQQFRSYLMQKGLQIVEANKRIDLLTPKFEKVDAGNRVIPGSVNQMTGEFSAQGQPIVKAPEGFVVGPDGGLQGDPGYIQAKKDIAAAGRPVTNINMGQKGFENELKLRGDFKQEPVYKAHQEMQAAYSQIQQSLKQASPAGDLAGATKIMKLLDPGSVVRESELGMAMAASGMLDRIQNYASNVINGTKLTPTQRADFLRLADALYQESVQQFNSKRGEYQQLGDDYGLKADRALGPEAKAVQQVTGAPKLGTTDQGYVFTGGDPADPKNWKKVQ